MRIDDLIPNGIDNLGFEIANDIIRSDVAPTLVWILATGFWNDDGIWDDTAVWID